MLRTTTRFLMSNCCAGLFLLVALAFPVFPAAALGGAVHLSDYAGGVSGQDFGAAVCGLGDVNGDGRDDVLVGAPGESNTGAAFLWFGSAEVTHAPSESWYGNADEKFGFSVAAIGDVNNDGDPDFAIGAPLANSPGADSGRICIYYGGSATFGSPDLIIGGQNGGDQFGFSVSAAGDFNGDGKDDFIVGAPYYSLGGLDIGAAYVIYGSNSGPSTDLADATLLVGEIAGDNFGWSVCSAGNFLGGSEESVAVGAPNNDNQAGSAAGAVYVYEGAVPPSNPNSTSDHILTVGGTAPNSRYGWVVRNAGRWDNDSYDDLAVGAPTHNVPGSSAGRVEIIFGDLSPSTTGDRYVTGGNAGDQLGYSLGNLGDYTGNNRSDLIIGAPFLVDDGVSAGRAYIYVGGTSSSGSVSILDAFAVDPLVPGNNANNRFGFAVDGIGDFDGDGSLDFATGAPGGQIGNASTAGYCRLQASDNQTVANSGFQGTSTWTDDSRVRLHLILPYAPEAIAGIEIRRLPDTIIYTGSVAEFAGQNSGNLFHYEFMDEGPFPAGDSSSQLSYGAIISLTSGAVVQMNDPAQWQPLSLEQQPAQRNLRARQAWPNPANPRTALEYSVADGNSFRLTIRDLRGRLVRNLQAGTGSGQWVTSFWDGLDDQGQALPSGLYFFDLRTGDSLEVRKVILAR